LLAYLDMPIQHADRTVLRTMNRPSDIDMTRRLIDHARSKLPDLAMRTTFIVGYPGETEAQFSNLQDFVKEMEFDHVGVFTYSPEPGTKAVTLDLTPVSPTEATARRNAIMETQQAISFRKNRALVGAKLEILIEAVGEAEDEAGAIEPISVGRARRHAPEVDGLVFVPGALPVGQLIELTVAQAGPYDLWAESPDRLMSVVNHDQRRSTPVRVGPRRRGESPRARPTLQLKSRGAKRSATPATPAAR
jgi:ribosomal protein S12 methylthiotransferase